VTAEVQGPFPEGCVEGLFNDQISVPNIDGVRLVSFVVNTPSDPHQLIGHYRTSGNADESQTIEFEVSFVGVGALPASTDRVFVRDTTIFVIDGKPTRYSWVVDGWVYVLSGEFFASESRRDVALQIIGNLLDSP
jgi:hypothetical protein